MDKMSAVRAALAQVQQAVDEADGMEMVGKRAPPAMAEESMPEECAAGLCEHPEHMSEDSLSALEM